MSSPTTRLSYLDCFELYDRALETPNGIRFRVPDHGAAINLRMRLHMARKIDRDANALIHQPGDSLYGCSIYDPLHVRIEDCWLFIEPRYARIIGPIEDLLPYKESTQWLENAPPKLISHSGTALLEKKSDSISNAPTDHSSLTPSTKPDKTPGTPNLRRL